MDEPRTELYEKCREKLLSLRQEYLQGMESTSDSLTQRVEGDEGDMAQALEGQHIQIAQREKLMSQVREIDNALSRIDAGTYGICDITEEPIEEKRLLAIPWTKTSLEGAEILEKRSKSFAG